MFNKKLKEEIEKIAKRLDEQKEEIAKLKEIKDFLLEHGKDEVVASVNRSYYPLSSESYLTIKYIECGSVNTIKKQISNYTYFKDIKEIKQGLYIIILEHKAIWEGETSFDVKYLFNRDTDTISNITGLDIAQEKVCKVAEKKPKATTPKKEKKVVDKSTSTATTKNKTTKKAEGK